MIASETTSSGTTQTALRQMGVGRYTWYGDSRSAAHITTLPSTTLAARRLSPPTSPHT